MAIVDLGTQNLIIGQPPSEYTGFAFNRRRAYLIYGRFTVSNFSNIASRVILTPVLDIPNSDNFYHPDTTEVLIRQETFSFWIPFSRLFGQTVQHLSEPRDYPTYTAEQTKKYQYSSIYSMTTTQTYEAGGTNIAWMHKRPEKE